MASEKSNRTGTPVSIWEASPTLIHFVVGGARNAGERNARIAGHPTSTPENSEPMAVTHFEKAPAPTFHTIPLSKKLVQATGEAVKLG